MLGKKVKYIGGYVIGNGIFIEVGEVYNVFSEHLNGNCFIESKHGKLLILKKEMERYFEVVE